MTKEDSIKISYGMFISCVVIVLHHSVGYFYEGQSMVDLWIFRLLHTGVFSFSMPFFFFWSGFFCERKLNKGYAELIKSKFWSLLVPYFLWNAIWTLLAIVFFLAGQQQSVFSWDKTLNSIVQGLLLYKYNGQYWYMLQLIVLALLSCYIDKIVRSRKLFIVAILLTLFAMLIGFNFGQFSLEGLAAYLFGAHYYSNNKEYKNHIPYPGWIAIFVITIFCNTSLNRYVSELIVSVLNFLSTIAFWNVLDIVKKRNVSRWMENYFFVYSFHQTPQLIIDKVLFSVLHLILNGVTLALATTILGALLTILAASICVILLEKTAPVLFKLLNGGRIRINS